MKLKPSADEVTAAVSAMMKWVTIAKHFSFAEVEQIAIDALKAAAEARKRGDT